ncbi:MAG: hypothetical protein ACR2N9_01600 [Acidimicrobiia bacterium]
MTSDPIGVPARSFGERGLFVRSGDYAYEVMRRLCRSAKGLVRIGFAHYNAAVEVDGVLSILDDFR